MDRYMKTERGVRGTVSLTVCFDSTHRRSDLVYIRRETGKRGWKPRCFCITTGSAATPEMPGQLMMSGCPDREISDVLDRWCIDMVTMGRSANSNMRHVDDGYVAV